MQPITIADRALTVGTGASAPRRIDPPRFRGQGSHANSRDRYGRHLRHPQRRQLDTCQRPAFALSLGANFTVLPLPLCVAFKPLPFTRWSH